MAFVNLPILMLGSVLISVPIVLHLMMRQKAKHLIFPALRFLQLRSLPNKRRLQLRHWLLLLLRCAAIFLLAAALARPSVASALLSNWLVISILALLLVVSLLFTILSWTQKRGGVLSGILSLISLGLLAILAVTLTGTLRKGSNVLVGNQEAPVAAALVFDASPRMGLRFQNQTRLERAQEIALWLLQQLPKESSVAIADTRGGVTGMAVDVSAAARAVESLEPTSLPRPLAQVVGDAIQLVQESEKLRREVYVFSDLTIPAWSSAEADSKIEADNVSIQVIDVGVEKPANFGLGDLKLSADTLAAGSPLRLHTSVASIGGSGSVTVELNVEKQDPSLPIILDGEVRFPDSQTRGRESCELEAGGSQRVDFELLGLDPGIHHGNIRLVADDGLAIDNARYFTIRVGQPWRVLVAAPAGALVDHLINVLSPGILRETQRAKFECETIEISELQQTELSDFDAVAILDPTPIADRAWQALAAYAKAGGGVAVFLGPNADPIGPFNEPAAQELFPGLIQSQWRAPDGILLLRNLSHPIFEPFRPMATSVPWDTMPVFRHWWLTELEENAFTVLRYGNDQAAIIEQAIGEGRVLTITTPISESHNDRRRLWNRLPTGIGAWPFVVLMDRMFLYLVNQSESKSNYIVGEEAALEVDEGPAVKRYQLFSPRGDWQQVSASDGQLRISFTEQPGTYRLQPGGDSQLGFSVNLPQQATRLDRISPERLDELFGADRYRLATSEDEIQRDIGESRIGREFYPFLVVVFVIVLGMENLLANRFYRS